MVFGTMSIAVLPFGACAIQIREGRRIRVFGIQRAHGIRGGVGCAHVSAGGECAHYFTPAPPLVSIAACCWRAFSSAWSMLKLDGR